MKKKLKNKWITIVGTEYYFGTGIFSKGAVLTIKKDFDNQYDSEAIKVLLGKSIVGYVANSTYTVMNGTYSAGRIYDKMGKKKKVVVILIDKNKAIAEIIN